MLWGRGGEEDEEKESQLGLLIEDKQELRAFIVTTCLYNDAVVCSDNFNTVISQNTLERTVQILCLPTAKVVFGV